MGLNIKNQRVHELARQAASRTGKSQTSVIEEALRRYLDELDDSESEERRRQRVDQVLGEMQRLIREQGGLGMQPDDLYDPITGLPA